MHGNILNQLLNKTAWNFHDMGIMIKLREIFFFFFFYNYELYMALIVQGLLSASGITSDKVLI